MTVTVHSHSFKRLLIGLSPGSASQCANLAAELAGQLHLELLGLFLDDSNLRNLAGIPFAREFRPLGAGWRPMHTQQIAQELDLAARNVERAFAQVARELTKGHQFEILRGPIGKSLAALSQRSDIIMIVEPVSAVERATQQFSWLVEAAFQSSAAVMLVPTHIARKTGPVVAIAAGPDDPSIRIAADIALATKETLVIIQAFDGDADSKLASDLAARTGLRVRLEILGSRGLASAESYARLLARIPERLIVMSRTAAAHDLAAALVASRHVPILLLEPETASG